MLNYLDILDRANDGPYLSEENWDLEKIAMTTKRLVKKYKLDSPMTTPEQRKKMRDTGPGLIPEK